MSRNDQRGQAARRLRELIADGLASGEGRAASEETLAELCRAALDADR